MGIEERVIITREYYEWLKENPTIKDSPLTVVSFLAMTGRLKTKGIDEG